MKLKMVLALALALLALPCLAGAPAPREKLPARAQCTMDYVTVRGSMEPVLILDYNGVRLAQPERVAQNTARSLESIRTILLALSPRDWPNGCFVALSEAGLRRANDDPVIEQYEQELNRMLKAIGVQVGAGMSA